MASPIAEYQEAVKRLEAATRGAESLQKILGNAAYLLNSGWRKAHVSNIDVGFPPEIIMAQRRSERDPAPIDARTWPSAKQIAETLAEYHQARANLQQKYGMIPEAERSVVNRPEAYDQGH